MKQIFLFVVALCLAGCGPSSESQQQTKADAALEEAFKVLNRMHQASAPAAEGTARDLEAERQQQLVKAAEHLRQAGGTGSRSRQVGVKTLAAEIQAAQARHAARGASRAWVQQSMLSSRLMSAAGSLRLANQLAEAQGKVDYTQELTKLRETETALLKDKDTLAEKAGADAKNIERLEAEIKQAAEARAAKIEQSQQISRKAFAQRGIEQFESYKHATALVREADLLNSNSERSAAQLDILTAQHKLDQATIKQMEEQLAGIKEAVSDIEQRTKSNADMAAESRKRADALTADFKKYLEQFGKDQTASINAPFDAAAKMIAESIAQLEPEIGAASDESVRRHAQMELSSLKGELGQLLTNQALIDAAYHAVLKSLADSLAKGAPDKASLLADSLTGAETRANESAAAAKKALDSAANDLKTLADGAKSAGEKSAEVVALKQQLAVTVAANSLESNPQAGLARVNELRARLAEIEN